MPMTCCSDYASERSSTGDVDQVNANGLVLRANETRRLPLKHYGYVPVLALSETSRNADRGVRSSRPSSGTQVNVERQLLANGTRKEAP